MKPATIKICGLTRGEDVRAGVEAGADLFGFVHHEPSPRHVSEADLVPLVALVPEGKASVLVVVDGEVAALARLMENSGATFLQLCGDQDPDAFKGFGFSILRRIGVQEGALVQMARWFGVAEGFVLDHPSSAGGSGLLVDQTCARELAATGPCLLAGGLDPETVASAIRATCPLGVDASSRLESSPGQKDPQRVRDFVRHAQRAFAQQESPS